MATSSITANFEIRDPKAERAFVDGLWKAYRTRPPRRPKNVQFVSVSYGMAKTLSTIKAFATPWEVCFNVACPCLIKGGLK